MSLVQTLHYELGTPSESPPAPNPPVDVPLQTTPDDGQPVFERAPLTVVNKPRRVIITALIILANVAQMTVNFAGIAGGSEITKSMGIKDSYASWIAASYAYITPPHKTS
ncbi:hypothetical protein EYZ11_001019 [Aspergillus tanneri]|uniref:Major facilitator superfamily (MFS) profile domain-containing protein n=1 Tax=Aspergillus tanneri TaxID=1220188 RepID=A0A4V3UQK6_9EURO|nr:hypothetical protein EYZ11_001019 [Aspergillus tanneri]